MAGESKASAENGSESTISKLNPIRYAGSAVGVIKSTFRSSGTQAGDGENKASADNSSDSIISKYNPIKHAGTAVGAIKSAFGSSGTPVGDDKNNGSAENGSESTISKYNPIKHVGTAVGAIKGAFGYFGTPGGVEENGSAENGSESTMSKYNPIKHAGTAVGAIKGAFGYFGTPGGVEENGSAENGSESTMSKYNPIKHAGTAVGAIRSAFGSSGTPVGDDKSNGSAENGSESSISKYNPIKHVGTAVGAIKVAFGYFGNPGGVENGSAENGSESTISKYNPIKHAGSVVGAIKAGFGYFGTSGGVEECNESAENGSESTISKFNPVGNAGSAVSANESTFGSSSQVGDGEFNSSVENGSESTRSKFNPLKYAGSAVGAIKLSFGYFDAPVGDRESKTLAKNSVDAIDESSLSSSVPPSNIGESNSSNSSRSHSNIFINPKSAIYGWKSAAGTDRDLMPTEDRQSKVFPKNTAESLDNSSLVPPVSPTVVEDSKVSDASVLESNSFSDPNSAIDLENSSRTDRDLAPVEEGQNNATAQTTVEGVVNSNIASSETPSGIGKSNAADSSVLESNGFTDPNSATDLQYSGRADRDPTAVVEGQNNAISKISVEGPVDCNLAFSESPSRVGERKKSDSSLSESNGFTDPKSAIDAVVCGPRTNRDLTRSTESFGSDSSNVVQMTSSSGVSVTLQTGSPSPVLNTTARATIASALRPSGRLTRDARFSSPAFLFGHPSLAENSLKDINGGFPTFGATISGALIKAYFAAKDGLFPGIKEMQNQETQTEEHITSQYYDVSAIWRMLECPVCFEIILSPVYQCKGGHIACYSCWSKVRKCPLCRSSRTTKRNYLAESLIEEIPLPCKYHAEGCVEIVQYNSKRGHEERCAFRITYQCPIDPLCNQIYGYKNMCIHLKDHHMNVCNFDNLVEERGSFCIPVFKESQNIVHVFHIKQWGLFFLQKVFVGDLTGWFMQVLPATTNLSDFNYSLDVCDHNETRKEYFKGCVLPVGKPTDEIINAGKYLILSDLILKTINVESPIMIVVRIWQNV